MIWCVRVKTMNSVKNEALHNGFALTCTPTGIIEDVILDESHPILTIKSGTPIDSLFDEGSAEKIMLFLNEATGNGAAFDWELITVQQAVIISYLCTAILLDEEILIIGATSHESVVLLVKELLARDLNRGCLFLLLERLQGTFNSTSQEIPLYNELYKMNSELSNLQRESVKKNFELERLNHKLQESEERFKNLNCSLEQQVFDSLAELRDKDQMLISQSRQAAMGEMISNIAHQWRQPLNALSMVIGDLAATQDDNELTPEYVHGTVATADRLIQKMSSTINDFRNFYSQDKQKVPFSLRTKIRRTVELVNASYKNLGISITVVDGEDEILFGFPGEYSQVLLNLLGNSKDAIVESAVTEGEITITACADNDMGVVTVRDNGGGIPESVLDKIYEPYFTTKSSGTGIGLYMSRTIIERNMGGRIEARNIDGGSEFTIRIPLAEE